MKRTTYIMIGMLVTGVAMVCGLMFYVVDRNVTQKDNFMEIGGERKTVQLPSCRSPRPAPPSSSPRRVAGTGPRGGAGSGAAVGVTGGEPTRAGRTARPASTS